MIHELDFHDNHKVNYTEFLASQIDLKKFLTIDRLNAIFSTFDTDGSGKITKQNLKDAFTKFGKEITDDEVDKIWKKHHLNGDTDANGITFDEFKKMIFEDD